MPYIRTTSARRRTAVVSDILATEPWTGTTGAAWPAQWTTAVAGTGVVNIDANRGRLTNAASSTAAGNKAYLSGINNLADLDATLSVTFSALASGAFYLFLRCPDSTTASTLPTNGYLVGIDPMGGATSAWVGKHVGGTYSDVAGSATVASGGWTANTARMVRFQALGNNLKVKFWASGSSEPATWNWQGTDTSGAAWTGKLWVGQRPWGTATWTTYLDDLVLTNGT